MHAMHMRLLAQFRAFYLFTCAIWLHVSSEQTQATTALHINSATAAASQLLLVTALQTSEPQQDLASSLSFGKATTDSLLVIQQTLADSGASVWTSSIEGVIGTGMAVDNSNSAVVVVGRKESSVFVRSLNYTDASLMWQYDVSARQGHAYAVAISQEGSHPIIVGTTTSSGRW